MMAQESEGLTKLTAYMKQIRQQSEHVGAQLVHVVLFCIVQILISFLIVELLACLCP